MSKITLKQKLFPRWEMPSDPVKAVWWFMHWLLKVLVRFFWLPIIVMVAFEAINNARVGNISDILVTLAIGLGLWGVLYLVLQLVNIWVKISQAISDANQVQQNMFNAFSYPYMRDDMNSKVVEGSISEIGNEEQKQ